MQIEKTKKRQKLIAIKSLNKGSLSSRNTLTKSTKTIKKKNWENIMTKRIKTLNTDEKKLKISYITRGQ